MFFCSFFPEILFLDEPTSGLDAFTTKALMDTLKSLASSGCAVGMFFSFFFYCWNFFVVVFFFFFNPIIMVVAKWAILSVLVVCK
jgi:hypothetical protein